MTPRTWCNTIFLPFYRSASGLLRGIGLLVLLVLSGLPAQGNASPAVWGYIPWWMQDDWRKLSLADYDRLIFFELPIAADGQLATRNGWPEQWRGLAQSAQRCGTPLEIALTVLDESRFRTVFNSPEARKTLLGDALALARDARVAGLHLDVEIYSRQPAAVTMAYRSFVAELALALRKLTPERHLSIFYPVGSPEPLYDAQTLSWVHGAVVQGYDAHWPEGPTAGPVAPLKGPEAVTWEKAVAEATRMGIPRDRIHLSFPLYGYEWPVTSQKARANTRGKGQETTFAPIPASRLPEVKHNVAERVLRYGAQHEAQSLSAWYHFELTPGQWVVGWFEDWWSLTSKADWLIANGLGGLAFFPLGYDHGALSDALKQHWRERRPERPACLPVAEADAAPQEAAGAATTASPDKTAMPEPPAAALAAPAPVAQ